MYIYMRAAKNTQIYTEMENVIKMFIVAQKKLKFMYI